MDRRIADYILTNAALLRDYSSQQLADALHVSQSSIVKFAQRMGFTGYPDLKLSVHESVARAAVVQEVAGHAESAHDADAARADALWLAKAAADRETRLLNDGDCVARVAAWLAEADTLFIAGVAGDGDAARTLARRLALLGRRCITGNPGPELLGMLSAAAPHDALLAICGDGRGPKWVPCCRAMRAAGGRAIAITRRRKTSLSTAADGTLVVAAHAPQPHIEDLVYEAAMRHLLDDLFLRILASRPESAETYRTNRDRILGGD